MKQTKYILFALIVLCSSIGHVAAQQVNDYPQLSSNEIVNISLPPLDILFENAKSAPRYQLAEVKTAIERKLLAKEKRAFLSFFSLRGSYQYGMFGNESTFTDVAVAPYLSYTTQAQNGYTVGAGINIPLDQLFDLKSRISRQRLNLKSAELERDVKYDELRKEIVEMYANAVSQLNVLKSRSESMVLANVQYGISERNFANGTIDSSQLSTDKERQSQASDAFEKTKFELTKSLMVLEIISRTSIIRK